MRYLLTIFLSLIAGVTLAQDAATISGEVKDALTGEPIADVHVQVIGSFFGDITDRNGRFKVEVQDSEASLQFTHVAYQTFILDVSTDTKEYRIELQPSVTILDPVSVNANEVEQVVENDSITIFNYSFLDGYLLLLTHNYYKRTYYLDLLSLDGERQNRTRLPDQDPYEFFTDCFGNEHFIGRDSSYQMYIQNNHVQFLYPVSKFKFLKAMEPCVVAKGDVAYLQAFDDEQHVVWYGLVQKGDTEAKDLRTIVDRETLKKLNQYQEYLAFRVASGLNNFHYEDYVDFGNLIFKKPIYAPLFQVGGKILVFNHPEDVIEKYAWEAYEAEIIPIAYHQERSFERQILIDPVLNHAYAVFEKQEHFWLQEIDLDTGKVSEAVHLHHRFPDKIKVYNGSVYYLYNTVGEKEQMLYRQSLK